MDTNAYLQTTASELWNELQNWGGAHPNQFLLSVLVSLLAIGFIALARS